MGTPPTSNEEQSESRISLKAAAAENAGAKPAVESCPSKGFEGLKAHRMVATVLHQGLLHLALLLKGAYTISKEDFQSVPSPATITITGTSAIVTDGRRHADPADQEDRILLPLQWGGLPWSPSTEATCVVGFLAVLAECLRGGAKLG